MIYHFKYLVFLRSYVLSNISFSQPSGQTLGSRRIGPMSRLSKLPSSSSSLDEDEDSDSDESKMENVKFYHEDCTENFVLGKIFTVLRPKEVYKFHYILYYFIYPTLVLRINIDQNTGLSWMRSLLQNVVTLQVLSKTKLTIYGQKILWLAYTRRHSRFNPITVIVASTWWSVLFLKDPP